MYLIRMILTSKSVRVWSARLYSIFCKLLLKLYTWPLGLVSQGWTHGFPTLCRICTFLSLKDLSSWAGEQSKYHSLLDFFFFLFLANCTPLPASPFLGKWMTFPLHWHGWRCYLVIIQLPTKCEKRNGLPFTGKKKGSAGDSAWVILPWSYSFMT